MKETCKSLKHEDFYEDAPFICIEPVNGIADEDIYQSALAN